MRAARLHEIGGIPRVDEIDEPGGPDVLAVTASSLNPVDISTGNGRFYGGMPETPYVIGSEAVGRDGRRAAALVLRAAARWPSASRSLEPDRAVEIPDGVDDRLALACGTAGPDRLARRRVARPRHARGHRARARRERHARRDRRAGREAARRRAA